MCKITYNGKVELVGGKSSHNGKTDAQIGKVDVTRKQIGTFAIRPRNKIRKTITSNLQNILSCVACFQKKCMQIS